MPVVIPVHALDQSEEDIKHSSYMRVATVCHNEGVSLPIELQEFFGIKRAIPEMFDSHNKFVRRITTVLAPTKHD
jgi:hypothetical protein